MPNRLVNTGYRVVFRGEVWGAYGLYWVPDTAPVVDAPAVPVTTDLVRAARGLVAALHIKQVRLDDTGLAKAALRELDRALAEAEA